VDKSDRHSLLARPGDQERPELRLRQKQQAGADGRQGLADRSREVQRKGEDRDPFALQGLGGFETRGGGDGDARSDAGGLAAERSKEVARDADFPDGHGVDPDASGGVREGEEAEFPAQTPHPAALSQRPEERDGGVGEQGGDGEHPVEEHPTTIIAYNSRAYVRQKASNARHSASV